MSGNISNVLDNNEHVVCVAIIDPNLYSAKSHGKNKRIAIESLEFFSQSTLVPLK